jgi:dihydrodipicolinate synthase/N-acetylneuraminate lyase
MSVNLGAILTAMVTPFDAGGAVDEAAALRLRRCRRVRHHG